MVTKVEAACQRAGVEFLGWEINQKTDEIKLRLQRGEVLASLKLSFNAFELMSGDKLSTQILKLFEGPKGNQS